MIINRNPSHFVAIVSVCVLLFQFGACSYAGKPQKIPVTSDPVGAKVFVDGKEAGTAPLNLSLKREEDHVIRVEKTGFVPVEIRVESKTTRLTKFQQIVAVILSIPAGGTVAGLLAGAIRGAGHTHEAFKTGFLIGGVLAPIGTVLLIRQSKHPRLSPGEVRVYLDEARGPAVARVVYIGRDEFQAVRWIRISCAAGGADAVVAVN